MGKTVVVHSLTLVSYRQQPTVEQQDFVSNVSLYEKRKAAYARLQSGKIILN